MENTNKKIIEAPLNPEKKISLNVNTTVLDLIKELSELTQTNNTTIINGLFLNGFRPLVRSFQISWSTMLGEAKDEERKKLLKGLLTKLVAISKDKKYKSLM